MKLLLVTRGDFDPLRIQILNGEHVASECVVCVALAAETARKGRVDTCEGVPYLP